MEHLLIPVAVKVERLDNNVPARYRSGSYGDRLLRFLYFKDVQLGDFWSVYDESDALRFDWKDAFPAD